MLHPGNCKPVLKCETIQDEAGRFKIPHICDTTHLYKHTNRIL